jgi:MerR HTH family regulatory protein
VSAGGIPPRPARPSDGEDAVEPAVEQPVELDVVARQAGLRVSLVRRYVSFGLFESCAGAGQDPLFPLGSAARVAKAERLRRDLGLNYAGAVLVCELLDRIRELEGRG